MSNLGWGLNAAADYAARGIPVFPLVPRGKRPLVAHGVLEATTDVNQLRDWWRHSPNANIGIPTGVAFDAVDLDGPAAAKWLDGHAPGWRRPGPVSITAKGEHHLCLPTGNSNRVRVAGFPVDVRARGGYICAPPSVHVSGHVYRWATPLTTSVPAMPELLVRLLWHSSPLRPAGEHASSSGWSPAGLLRTMAIAVEGNRNATLFWCARRVHDDLANGRVSSGDAGNALNRLSAIARARGLADREVIHTVRSAMRRDTP